METAGRRVASGTTVWGLDRTRAADGVGRRNGHGAGLQWGPLMVVVACGASGWRQPAASPPAAVFQPECCGRSSAARVLADVDAGRGRGTRVAGLQLHAAQLALLPDVLQA